MGTSKQPVTVPTDADVDEFLAAVADGRTADWPLVGFSPRKQQLVVYLAGGFAERHAPVLAGWARTAQAPAACM